MKIFTCQNCGQLLHFENTICVRCGMSLGFLPRSLTLSALSPGEGAFRAMADGGGWRLCGNARHEACNWMVPAEEPDDFCPSCDLNRTIPDLSTAINLERWRA